MNPESRIQNPIVHNTLSSSRRYDLYPAILIVGIALLLWETVTRVWQIPIYILPPPTAIAMTLFHQLGIYLKAALTTLSEALGGLLLGSITGIGIAIFLVFNERFERGVLALAILLKSTPMVAIAPLLIIWFGFGPLPKVIITGIITFFPVLVNMHSGLQATPKAQLDLFHSLNATTWEIFYLARWPASLPYLFAALKVVAPLSLVGAVVAEWAGASTGLGRTMWLAYTNLNLPALFAAVFCSTTMGVGLYTLVLALEKKVIFW